MTAGKNKVVVVFVLTGFGDADTSSEIQGLELCPELMPRAFPFVAARHDQPDVENICETSNLTPCTSRNYPTRRMATFSLRAPNRCGLPIKVQ